MHIRRSAGRTTIYLTSAIVLLSLSIMPGPKEHNASGPRTAIANGQRSNPPQPYSSCSDTTGRSPATGLPPVQCYRSPFDGTTVVRPYGARLAPTRAFASRIKTALSLPPLVLRANVAVCLGFVVDYPCPLNLRYPRADPTVTYGYFGIAGQAYVQSPPGIKPRYGVFPASEVHTLAFGSIPVSAKIVLRQPVGSNGYAAPLQIDFLTSAGAVAVGARIPGYEGFGPAPNFPGGQIFWNPPPHIEGPVQLQVRDLRIDGRPFDVGERCTSNAQLFLTARGGFYNSTGVTPGEGRPGEYSPLAPRGNSYLHGHLDIPAFRTCGSRGDNLAPLVTSFVSGSGTLVDVTQIGPLQPFCILEPADPTCTATAATLQGIREEKSMARLPARARSVLQQLSRTRQSADR